MYLSKPNICSPQLDVQDKNVCIPHFHWIWNYFVGCWIANNIARPSRPDQPKETCAAQEIIQTTKPKTKTPTEKSLGFGERSVSYFPKTNSTTPQIKCEETRRVTPHQTSTTKTKPRFQPSTTILIWVMLITKAKFSRFGAMLHILRIRKPWLKWSSKGWSPTTRHVSRTHRVALDWLFDRISLEPKTQTCWHQKPTRWHADQRKFHAWRVEPSSSFVEHH